MFLVSTQMDKRPIEIRVEFDKNPIEYFEANFIAMDRKRRRLQADYIKASPDEVALTDSTTMGRILYTGLNLKQVMNSDTTHDHYFYYKALDLLLQEVRPQSKDFTVRERCHCHRR